METLSNLFAPATWGCLALAAAALLAGAAPGRTPLRNAGRVLLVLAALLLVVALAHPLLLPLASAITHPDGSTDDPRVLSALFLAIASLLALVPAWRDQNIGPRDAAGVVLPGIIVAGALGAVAYFAGLRQPLALTGIVAGALGAISALVLAFRGLRAKANPAALVLAFATSLLAMTAMASLHGARSGALAMPEGAAVDTLGYRLYVGRIEAPDEKLRRIGAVLYWGEHDSTALAPELKSKKGHEMASLAAGRMIDGPVLVPISLDEQRPKAHDVTWIGKSDSLLCGGCTIRLAGFRFAKGDTIRFFADLDVMGPTGTQRVSPGMAFLGGGKDKQPFAGNARDLGPILVVGVDADHGRAALILPKLSENNVHRIATLELRLRPLLPMAWGAALLAVIALLLAFCGGAPAAAAAAATRRH